MDESITEFEEWKPIVGYEGLYSISSFGRVKCDSARRKSWVGKIVQDHLLNSGYLRINIRDREGLRKGYTVHKLATRAFLGERQSNQEVNHKDSNKLNNNISNLEYVTKRENSLHALGKGRTKQFKLTENQVREIREKYCTGSRSQVNLASEYGVRQSTISSIVIRESWSHI